MEITYTKQGDYLLPNIAMKQSKDGSIGKYGLLRLNYLKQHKKALYQVLLMREKLTNHLIDIDKNATERVESLVRELAEKEKVDEDLKATDQLKWIDLMNNFKSQAEEIVLEEIVYR